MHLSFSRAEVDFIKLFLQSEKLPTHGVWRKICHSISPTKLKDKLISQDSPNLCTIHQTPFAKKCVKFYLLSPKRAANFGAQMLMKSTPGEQKVDEWFDRMQKDWIE